MARGGGHRPGGDADGGDRERLAQWMMHCSGPKITTSLAPTGFADMHDGCQEPSVEGLDSFEIRGLNSRINLLIKCLYVASSPPGQAPESS